MSREPARAARIPPDRTVPQARAGIARRRFVTEVMINPDAVFAERSGRLEAVPGALVTPMQVRQASLAIARSLGDDISEEQPLLDARLPDGSRIAAAFPPAVSEARR